MRAPAFWQEDSWLATLLAPASWVYEAAAQRRWKTTTPVTLGIPVICVGNLVAGGAGKTPIALALGRFLMNKVPGVCFLSRGYGGELAGPVQVDTAHHGQKEVGDEALLLSELLPTFIGRDRLAAAQLAMQRGARLLIMDDGFQNPSLHKDISLLVVDGRYGFGNGRLLPAGPLREKVKDGLSRASAVILINEDQAAVEKALPAALPVLRAKMVPGPNTVSLADRRVVAFAGIGRPEKFHATLHELGCDIAAFIGFPDHHRFSAKDIELLRAKSAECQAILVTTAKDFVRLPPDFRSRVTVVEIDVRFENEEALTALLQPVLKS